jgi:hypothetical protein
VEERLKPLESTLPVAEDMEGSVTSSCVEARLRENMER